MIHIDKLFFGYGKGTPVFEELDFTLHAGSITGLLGKNGAGKTTLLKLIAGLIFPVAGKVEVLSHEPRRRNPSFLQQVFFVGEEFCLPSISIKRYLLANSPFYPNFDHDRMQRLLDEFELSTEKVIDQLSYGQKKKFLISFALATTCRLLMLDEPTNGLDIPSKTLFRKVMAGSLDENQLVLISTHQVKDIEALIDRIVILDHRKIIVEKDVLDISSQLQFSYNHGLQETPVLYSEPVPGGYKTITAQEEGSSAVDIELLFNAITKGNKIFRSDENP